MLQRTFAVRVFQQPHNLCTRIRSWVHLDAEATIVLLKYLLCVVSI